MTTRAAAKPIIMGTSHAEAIMTMMLFVQSAKVWKQQNIDGTSSWGAQAIQHPFLQAEPIFGKTPGKALVAAYSAWQQQNDKHDTDPS